MKTLPHLLAVSSTVDCTAREIVDLHNSIMAAALTSLDKAIRAGELLASIKAGLPHGEWLPWVKANLPFAERTARNYMRCHAERNRLKSASVADLTDAYRLLAPPPASKAEPYAFNENIMEALKAMSEANEELESRTELSQALAKELLAKLKEVESLATDLTLSARGASFHPCFAVGAICRGCIGLVKEKTIAGPSPILEARP